MRMHELHMAGRGARGRLSNRRGGVTRIAEARGSVMPGAQGGSAIGLSHVNSHEASCPADSTCVVRAPCNLTLASSSNSSNSSNSSDSSIFSTWVVRAPCNLGSLQPYSGLPPLQQRQNALVSTPSHHQHGAGTLRHHCACHKRASTAQARTHGPADVRSVTDTGTRASCGHDS